jgi:Asp-tRNA(Asn)/Glu-tRNA(Gln) amidotransferase A subunit family amidase
MILMVESAAMFDQLTLSNRDDELKQQHPLAWPNSFRTARMIPAVEYLKAQQARTVLMREMESVMKGLDVLVTPSTTGGTLPITNLTGHPAVVLPHGFVRGTPRSITFLGNLFGDDQALRLGLAYQNATDWHTQHPLLA